MRVLALLALVAACGFPQPPDSCEGPCMLLAVDRPIANAMEEIWLEGTFVDGSQVQFPGAAVLQSFDGRFDHRAKVTVPTDTTAGDLRVVTLDAEGVTIKTASEPIPFRRASFAPTLQPFMAANEQGDYARTNYLDRVHVGGAAVTIGNRLYLIGGYYNNMLTGDVEVATTGLDGGVGRPKPVGQQLVAARAGHTVTRIGRYVYVVGGTGTDTMASIERATIQSDGSLGPFEMFHVTLNTGRAGHASVVLGNFLYVIGGNGGGGDLDSVERARIDETGTVDNFERVEGIKLLAARSYFTVAYTGENLFVIGGESRGTPTASVERMTVDGSGYVAQFVPADHLVDARSHHVSVVLGGNVYVIGGKNAARTLTGVEVAPIINAESLMFSTMIEHVKLTEPKQDSALAVVGNYVYLFGGKQVGTGQDSDSAYPERASIIAGGTLAAFTKSQTTMFMPRTNHASVVLGNKLYVIGGATGTGVTPSIEVSAINPDGTFAGFGASPVSLKQGRMEHSLLVDNNTLYVFGGVDASSTPLDTVEAAPIAEDGTLGEFATVSDMTRKMSLGRHSFTMFAAGQEAFLLGGSVLPSNVPTANIERVGFTGSMFNFFVEPYNIKQARDRAASLAIGNYVYVIGGVNGSTYADIVRAPIYGFGLANDFAPYGANLNIPRHGHRAVFVGTTLYIIGGTKFGGPMNPPVEATQVGADGAFGAFTLFDALRFDTPRSRFTTVTLGNHVYFIGGEDNNGMLPLVTLETATIE